MHRTGNKNGFTLIEIILAILIISIAVVGMISAISFTTGKSLHAEVMSTAQELARERMEQLMAIKRDNGYSDPALDQVAMVLTPMASPFDRYSRGIEVCLVDTALGNPDCNPALPNTDLGYKQITVGVDYSGLADLSSPVVSLVTVVANVRE